MKKQPDQRLMSRRSLPIACRRILPGMAVLLIAALGLSACTNYRSVNQGASVPWAKSLAAKRSGPIAEGQYRVEQGDVLSSIAEQYRVRVSVLATANNIPPPYILYPGEVLRIPGDAPTPTKRPQVVQTALPVPAPAAAAAASIPAPVTAPAQPSVQQQQVQPAPAPTVAGQRYVVTPGDSIALIAVRHDLTLGELIAANGLEVPYKIMPDQVLIIPDREQRAARRQPAAQETGARTAPASAPSLSTEGFMWPVYGSMIGTFEQRSAVGRSGGVNIAAGRGTPVRASDNGVVAYAGEALSGYGRLVMLRHAEGYVTLYAHNDQVLVSEGDVVSRGQTIAAVGTSGDVSESQLHFEIRKGKAPVDPTKILAGLPGRQAGKI